jgi:16S rRNA (adenine1518-N6/adenine1519-N6)-dimethyltransferase
VRKIYSKPETRHWQRKSLGQCFLQDQNILRLEAKLAKPKNKIVLEIGAGDGRLTEKLLELGPKKVIAVEKDARFAEILREKFRGMPVEVLEEDFLKIRIPEVDVIVGNIPYYISSDIIFSLTHLGIDRAVLMVQKEFAQKMIAQPTDRNYGRLSVTSQLYYSIKLERIVPRHLFRPAPRVDSAIIILKPTGTSLTQFEENVIRYLFQQKNKKVRNALRASRMFEDEEIDKLGNLGKKKVRRVTKEECLEIARFLE